MRSDPSAIQRLSEQIDRIAGESAKAGLGGRMGSVPTGWEPIDRFLGSGLGEGLARGAIHEWMGASGWPPLCILSHLAQQAARAMPGRVIVWVGRRVWAYPRVLMGAHGRDASLLENHCVFVDAPDAPDASTRLWAIDLALRSEAVAAVVGDGAGLDRRATRRLQIAGERGGALGLIARPFGERRELSAATSRWVVVPESSSLLDVRERRASRPRWSVELLRCKGVRPASDPWRWVLEWDGATSAIGVSPDVVDRSGAPRKGRPARSVDPSILRLTA